nr:hypothetical protein [Pandoravirus massiliensis]
MQAHDAKKGIDDEKKGCCADQTRTHSAGHVGGRREKEEKYVVDDSAGFPREDARLVALRVNGRTCSFCPCSAPLTLCLFSAVFFAFGVCGDDRTVPQPMPTAPTMARSKRHRTEPGAKTEQGEKRHTQRERETLSNFFFFFWMLLVLCFPLQPVNSQRG